ncbi:MAG: hypothetical protein KAT47_01775 [Candidatus Aegiribacteria sp.]|nr:hypothetical protein [Candidatus Aegiribacteria sp.]
MNRDPGKLHTRMMRLRKSSITGIREVFGKWIRLPEEFGQPVRNRLFFPLTGILGVSFSSALT